MCSLCGGTEGAWVPALVALVFVSCARFKDSIKGMKNKILRR